MFFTVFNIKINISHILLPIIYIIVGISIFKVLKNLIIKTIDKRKNLKVTKKKRDENLGFLIVNIVKYIIVIFVVLGILSVYGFNVKSILAGLGIGTAIIGLAFQDLAKDIIAGFSIITEGEYEIGDTIEIDGFMGEVVFIGLRTTRIRNFKGATKIIANHYMDNIINYSDNNSLAVVDVSIAYEEKEEKIEETFYKLFEDLNKKLEYANKDIELRVMNELSEYSLIYKVAIETKKMKHIITERQMKKEIKKAFDKANIKIPYNQIEVHNGK